MKFTYINLNIILRSKLLIVVGKIEMRIWKIYFIMERQKDLVKRKNNLSLTIRSFILRDSKKTCYIGNLSTMNIGEKVRK